MILSRKILQVFPNPFSAGLDHEGRPCGVFQADPEHYPGVKHVGATVRPTVIGVRKMEYTPVGQVKAGAVGPHGTVPAALATAIVPSGARTTTARIDVSMVYEMSAPSRLQDTHYHRAAIRGEELIAADEQTARIAGVKYQDPASVLARWRALRVKEWVDQHGEEPDYSIWPAVDMASSIVPATTR